MKTLTLILQVVFLFILSAALTGCGSSEGGEAVVSQSETIEGYVYTVTRISEPVEINSQWDKEPWNRVEPLHLGNHMGDDPDPRPNVHVKVAYDNDAIYLIYHVEDQYVRCVVDEYQGPVSRDSCVEFFFTPGMEVSKGYYNLEINCGGTGLFAFQRERGVDRVNIPWGVYEAVDVATSMPRIVEPEIEEPVTWTLEVRLPFDILEEYTDFTHPESGVEWRANFYKIASGTSHPHYMTWSFVDNPTPQFHLPEFFGTIRFE